MKVKLLDKIRIQLKFITFHSPSKVATDRAFYKIKTPEKSKQMPDSISFFF
jgi:hypothetical protein